MSRSSLSSTALRIPLSSRSSSSSLSSTSHLPLSKPKKKPSTRPSWDSTNSDLSLARLTPHELLQKHLRHLPKEKLMRMAGMNDGQIEKVMEKGVGGGGVKSARTMENTMGLGTLDVDEMEREWEKENENINITNNQQNHSNNPHDITKTSLSIPIVTQSPLSRTTKRHTNTLNHKSLSSNMLSPVFESDMEIDSADKRKSLRNNQNIRNLTSNNENKDVSVPTNEEFSAALDEAENRNHDNNGHDDEDEEEDENDNVTDSTPISYDISAQPDPSDSPSTARAKSLLHSVQQEIHKLSTKETPSSSSSSSSSLLPVLTHVSHYLSHLSLQSKKTAQYHLSLQNTIQYLSSNMIEMNDRLEGVVEENSMMRREMIEMRRREEEKMDIIKGWMEKVNQKMEEKGNQHPPSVSSSMSSDTQNPTASNASHYSIPIKSTMSSIPSTTLLPPSSSPSSSPSPSPSQLFHSSLPVPNPSLSSSFITPSTALVAPSAFPSIPARTFALSGNFNRGGNGEEDDEYEEYYEAGVGDENGDEDEEDGEEEEEEEEDYVSERKGPAPMPTIMGGKGNPNTNPSNSSVSSQNKSKIFSSLPHDNRPNPTKNKIPSAPKGSSVKFRHPIVKAQEK